MTGAGRLEEGEEEAGVAVLEEVVASARLKACCRMGAYSLLFLSSFSLFWPPAQQCSALSGTFIQIAFPTDLLSYMHLHLTNQLFCSYRATASQS